MCVATYMCDNVQTVLAFYFMIKGGTMKEDSFF